MARETKDLEFIQSIITRLAGNSFQMKGWNVALASAVIGFAAAKDSHPSVAVFAVVPSCAFWVLDAYYLALERLYRNLYVTKRALSEPDYDLATKELGVGDWGRAFIRPSVVGVHCPLLIVIVLVTLTGLLRK